MSGQRELAFPLHDRRLDIKDIPSSLGPCQPGSHADFIFLLLGLREKLEHAQIALQVGGCDRIALHLPLGHFFRDLPHHVRDLALEIPNARLSGVVRDDPVEGRFGEPEVFVRDAVLLELTRDEIPPGNAELFFFRVSRDFDDLHSIPQSRENRIDKIRGGDEHHLGEIKGNT